VSELFRSWPGSRRSDHQHSSFAAWGRGRDELLALHRLDDRFGDSSPLARFYELAGRVLFLGTGFDSCTCFHLAEYRRKNPPTREYKAVVLKDGQRALIEYTDVDTDSTLFGEIGREFEQQQPVRKTMIGRATCRLFSVRLGVDFARDWLDVNSARHRSRPGE
jgi:aminoglycoside 3-N-acetyltransferase